MTHATKMTAVEVLRHQIDVWSTLCLAAKDDKRPDVIEKREKLERSLAEARALLVKLQPRGELSS